MENQHRKISGYRELSQEEIDHMNALKALGLEFKKIIDVMAEMPEIDKRWLDAGTMELQVGIMSLVRSIAKPGGF